MELFFIVLLVLLMATALGSGFPVAFALPGSAILTVSIAALAGYLVAGSPDAYFSQGGPAQWLTAGVTNFRGVYWVPERDTLIAIPLFVFMGIMLQRSRIAEDLLVTMAQLFGPVRGGLGMSVVFVGALLAATTGIVGATVVAMGLISLPAMLRNKYSHPLATGTIAASGTLGQIIPPSIVLIILADQLSSATDQASSARKAFYKLATGELTMPSQFDVTSTSAGEMFLGAFVPGLVLVAVYIIFIMIYAQLRPEAAPAVRYEGKYDLRFAVRVFLVLVPPLALIFAVLGSIILGIATVNQAGAIGAVGAMIMAGYRLYAGRRGAYWPVIISLIALTMVIVIAHVHPINVKKITTEADAHWLMAGIVAVTALIGSLLWSGYRTLKVDNTLQGVMVETAKTTSLVFIILIGAAMLTAAFRSFGGEDLVKNFLTGLPGGFWGQFFTVMAVIFVLGFFLDFIEISVVVVPIVAPILLADPGANITAVWLGVMIGLNIQTSFLTPPFGFALFYLRGVAPASVKTLSMYRGVVAFICMQLLVLSVVAITPRLVNYLPMRVSLTAETAPPPVNPKLQPCLERYLFGVYKQDGDKIRSAIAKARQLDLSVLPDKLRKDVAGSFDKAEKTFPLVEDAKKTAAAIDAASPAYRSIHDAVRETQEKIRRDESRIKDIGITLSQLDANEAGAKERAEGLKAQLAGLKAEQKTLTATISSDWEERHKTFTTLLKADNKARLIYRRNVDAAYQPIKKAVEEISTADDLEALQPTLQGIHTVIEREDPDRAAEHISQLLPSIGEVPGASGIRSAFYKVRKHLISRTPDKPKALEQVAEAMQLYRDEMAWRKRAKSQLLPGLSVYEEAIRTNIGLRQQQKLPKAQAVEIAGCLAQPDDISLYF